VVGTYDYEVKDNMKVYTFLERPKKKNGFNEGKLGPGTY